MSNRVSETSFSWNFSENYDEISWNFDPRIIVNHLKSHGLAFSVHFLKCLHVEMSRPLDSLIHVDAMLWKVPINLLYKKETFQRCRYVYLLPSTMRRQQALFNINFSFLVTIVALLPLLGALTCIILSILFNFKESTWTHCRVSATFNASIQSLTSEFPFHYRSRIQKIWFLVIFS